MRRQTLPTEPYAPAPHILQTVPCKYNEVPSWNSVFNKGSPTKYSQALTYANSSFFMKYSTMMMTQIIFLTAVNLSEFFYPTKLPNSY